MASKKEKNGDLRGYVYESALDLSKYVGTKCVKDSMCSSGALPILGSFKGAIEPKCSDFSIYDVSLCKTI